MRRYVIVVDNVFVALYSHVALLRSMIDEGDDCEVIGFTGFLSVEMDEGETERLFDLIRKKLKETDDSIVHIVIDICLTSKEEDEKGNKNNAKPDQEDIHSGIDLANKILKHFQSCGERLCDRIEITFVSVFVHVSNNMNDYPGIAGSELWKGRKAYGFQKPCDNNSGSFNNHELPEPRFGGKTTFEAYKNHVIKGIKEE